MKKAVIIILALIASFSTYAQSSQIVATAHKEIFRVNNNWGNWPNHWTSYRSEGLNNPVIRISTVSDGPEYIYRLQMFIGGTMEADFVVTYDPVKTRQIRDQWDDEYVNCYKDFSGDYVFTQQVSLESLAKDNRAWSSNDDSQLYLMVYSEDFCVVVR